MASSMTECCKRDHAAIKCCLRSSTSCIAVRYTLFCMTSQLCNLPDLNPYGDQSSGPVNCGIPRVIKAREGITSTMHRCTVLLKDKRISVMLRITGSNQSFQQQFITVLAAIYLHKHQTRANPALRQHQ